MAGGERGGGAPTLLCGVDKQCFVSVQLTRGRASCTSPLHPQRSPPVQPIFIPFPLFARPSCPQHVAQPQALESCAAAFPTSRHFGKGRLRDSSLQLGGNTARSLASWSKPRDCFWPISRAHETGFHFGLVWYGRGSCLGHGGLIRLAEAALNHRRDAKRGHWGRRLGGWTGSSSRSICSATRRAYCCVDRGMGIPACATHGADAFLSCRQDGRVQTRWTLQAHIDRATACCTRPGECGW